MYVIGLSESKTINLDFVKTVIDIDNSFYCVELPSDVVQHVLGHCWSVKAALRLTPPYDR